MTTADADQAPARSAPIGAAIADPEHHLDLDKDGYLASIGHIMDQLRAGESYEVCLTNELRVAYRGDPFALYLAQRRTNPAPYAAYLAVGASTVLCSSPEQFLRIGADGTVQSRPIKGTAARAADSAADDAGAVDDAIRDGLRRSEKTRAENLMIVDLLRNDLGRVCEIGSVTVPDFMVVETYETMHQLVSTVRGMLRADVAATDAVRACFPGGSMTGAPKVRTMEIIERLEGRPRGVYSGSLGYLSADGCADLNIVIRTAVVTAAGDQADTVPGKAQPAGAVVIAGASRAPGSGPGVVVGELTVGAGGAIVLGSDPEAEYQEMLTKLRAPIRALVERG